MGQLFRAGGAHALSHIEHVHYYMRFGAALLLIVTWLNVGRDADLGLVAAVTWGGLLAARVVLTLIALFMILLPTHLRRVRRLYYTIMTAVCGGILLCQHAINLQKAFAEPETIRFAGSAHTMMVVLVYSTFVNWLGLRPRRMA